MKTKKSNRAEQQDKHDNTKRVKLDYQSTNEPTSNPTATTDNK